jgi:hypothetical protein
MLGGGITKGRNFGQSGINVKILKNISPNFPAKILAI